MDDEGVDLLLLYLIQHTGNKQILSPPSKREFKDIYVVSQLMESYLHQVIKANDDLISSFCWKGGLKYRSLKSLDCIKIYKLKQQAFYFTRMKIQSFVSYMQ